MTQLYDRNLKKNRKKLRFEIQHLNLMYHNTGIWQRSLKKNKRDENVWGLKHLPLASSAGYFSEAKESTYSPDAVSVLSSL